MDPKTSVFEETYQDYLARIEKVELKPLEERLGISVENNEARISLFEKPYIVSKNGVSDLSGKQPSLVFSVVLCRYLLMCPEKEPDEGDWTAFRDFKDTGPLTVYHSQDVEQPIIGRFSGKITALEKACKALGGTVPQLELPYELSMQFYALPKIPMLLLFNDSDDEFPAGCSVLFRKNAEKYLDGESLAILGALFSSKLVKIPLTVMPD